MTTAALGNQQPQVGIVDAGQQQNPQVPAAAPQAANPPRIEAPQVPMLPVESQDMGERIKRAVGKCFLLLAVALSVTGVALVVVSLLVQPFWGSCVLSIISAIFFGIFATSLTQDLPVPSTYAPLFDATRSAWTRNRYQEGLSVRSRVSRQPAFIQGQPGVGIYNGGNTCFMNAVMQPILNDPVMKQAMARSIERPARDADLLIRLAVFLVRRGGAAAAPAAENGQPEAPSPEVLRSLVRLFSSVNYIDARIAFRTYAQNHPDDAAAALFWQKVAAGIQAIFEGNLVPNMTDEELRTCAPLIQTIVQTPALRDAIINGALAEDRRSTALCCYKSFDDAYTLALRNGKSVVDSTRTLSPFRGFMPEGERQGQQDAHAFLAKLFDFVDPQEHAQFFHTSTLRKHSVEIPNGELTEAQRQNLLNKTAEMEQNPDARNQYVAMPLDGYTNEERTIWDIGLKFPVLPPPEPENNNASEELPVNPAAPAAPLAGQELLNAYYAESDVAGDEPVVRLKEDGTLAYFRPDRQQIIVPAAGDLHEQQRLHIRLDRFASEIGENLQGQVVQRQYRENTPVLMPSELDVGDVHYNQWAVVCHVGRSAQAGHYTALVKDRQGQWWLFDDESVRRVTPEFKNQYLLVNGYMFFYQRAAAPVAEPGAPAVPPVNDDPASEGEGDDDSVGIDENA